MPITTEVNPTYAIDYLELAIPPIGRLTSPFPLDRPGTTGSLLPHFHGISLFRPVASFPSFVPSLSLEDAHKTPIHGQTPMDLP